MIPPGEARGAARLDRPPGYFPRGTSLGLVGLLALSVGVPFCVLACAAPLSSAGFDRWLGSIPYVLGLGLVPALVFIAGARTHRYWTVCAFFYFGCALLLAYVLGLVFALVALFGAFPLRDAGLRSMGVVGALFMLALGLPAWFLLRALRLRYWRPGSLPESWEKGDEGPPAWAMSGSRKP